ncbi:MAG: hypothetical protein L0Y54_02565 [Sporichthyaceae bacterium]|nr:hypothetical protein [Sporichthyaceae bacterium]
MLDTSAVLGYASGSLAVGHAIARSTENGVDVVVPVLCLAESYRRADTAAIPMLEILTEHPSVVLAPVGADDGPILGAWARALDDLDLAHAVVEAASRPMMPLMTSHRERARRILPTYWPIIDV